LGAHYLFSRLLSALIYGGGAQVVWTYSVAACLVAWMALNGPAAPCHMFQLAISCMWLVDGEDKFCLNQPKNFKQSHGLCLPTDSRLLLCWHHR